ncbi:hypothetical protein [Amycolatopsis sp. NPDC001319]|uniref:hypothetical protein n=1 Tax=unclassified Amycolatopsis TaxID=2618356 RepID=UPI0036A0E5D5
MPPARTQPGVRQPHHGGALRNARAGHTRQLQSALAAAKGARLDFPTTRTRI